MNEVKIPKPNNFYYVGVSIIYTYKKTKLDASYTSKDYKIFKACKSLEKTKYSLFKEFVQTNTVTIIPKKLVPNKYYVEYTIFKLDENNKRIYESAFYSKIIALHLKCLM